MHELRTGYAMLTLAPPCLRATTISDATNSFYYFEWTFQQVAKTASVVVGNEVIWAQIALLLLELIQQKYPQQKGLI